MGEDDNNGSRVVSLSWDHSTIVGHFVELIGSMALSRILKNHCAIRPINIPDDGECTPD